MKPHQFILIIFTLSLVITIAFSQVQPTWSAYSFLNSGEHKAVNYVPTSPSTFTYGQTFNTPFGTGVVPRVVLSLQGLMQSAPNSGSVDVGFKVKITSSNSTTFLNEVTIYGTTLTVLYYMYLGLDPAATQFYTQYGYLTFTTGNLVDTSSVSRLYTENRNFIGTTFNNYGTNQIATIVYLGGYKTQMGTTGLDIKVRASTASSSAYTFEVETGGDAIISQVTFFIIAFDKDEITGPPYTRVFDLGYYRGYNSVQEQYTSTLTTDSFMYRNFLMGYTEFELTDAVTTNIDNRIFLNPLSYQTFFRTDPLSSLPTYQYLYANIFHHRVRQCPTSDPYYVPDELKCYSACPSPYNQVNSSGNYCYQSTICGNGQLQDGEQCDDGNTDDGDGCSNTCVIEDLHICSQTVWNNGTSVCSYGQKLNLTLELVEKSATANRIIINLLIEANLCNSTRLQQYFQSLVAIEVYDISTNRLLLSVKASNILNVVNVQYTQNSDYTASTVIQLEYSEFLSEETLAAKSLKFVPSDLAFSKYFYLSPESTVSNSPYTTLTTLVPSNLGSLNYYTDSEYSAYQSLSYFAIVMLGLAYLFLLLILILYPKATVVPVEFLLLYQIVCFGVLAQSQIELGFASLLVFAKYSAFGGGGISIQTADSIYENSCTLGNGLNIDCLALNDVNIPLWIGIILMGIGFGIKTWEYRKQNELDELSSQASQKVREEAEAKKGNIVIKSYQKIYQLSKPVQILRNLSWELSFAIFYLMAIFVMISLVSTLQRQLTTTDITTSAVVILSIFLLFSVLLWINWFVFYPQFTDLSYVAISRFALSKLSFVKFHYFFYFWIILIWGILIPIVGAGSEILMLIFSLAWIALIWKGQIYKNKLHRIRSSINQIVIIITLIFYIVANFTEIDNLSSSTSSAQVLSTSFIFTILILVLVTLSLLVNIIITVLVIKRQKQEELESQIQYTNDSMLHEMYGSAKKSTNGYQESRVHSTDTKQKKFVPNGDSLMKQLYEIRSIRQQLKISYDPEVSSNSTSKKKYSNKKEAIDELNKMDKIKERTIDLPIETVQKQKKEVPTLVDSMYDDI